MVKRSEPTRALPSYAGLTRVSIHLRKKRFLRRGMDCRVKPGNDEGIVTLRSQHDRFPLESQRAALTIAQGLA
jgi:hypothetical protein